MCSKTRGSLFRTVSFRLTARYVLLFAGVSIAVLAISHDALKTHLASLAEDDLREDAREMAGVYRARGRAALQAEFDREVLSSGPDTVFFALLSPRGERLAASDLVPWPAIPLPPVEADALAAGDMALDRLTVEGHRFDTRVLAARLEGGTLLCLGHSMEDELELLALFRDGLVLALGMLLLAGGVLGWWLARRAMAGVIRVTQTAVRIGGTDLAERVVVKEAGEEIEQLAFAFNAMLERINALVTDLQEVINSIAHDVRSPITRMRGVAEGALIGPATIEDHREAAATVIEECDRLTQLINTVLDIAEADAGTAAASSVTVDLNPLAAAMHELFEPAARDKGIALTLAMEKAPLMIGAQPDRLRRVVSNLLDNAIRHTRTGGNICLAVSREGRGAAMTVTDDGEGIDPKDMPHIFKRFYRGDTSRSLAGHGLGLSLCEAIVRAHGGSIAVESRPGAGSTFRVRLPGRAV